MKLSPVVPQQSRVGKTSAAPVTNSLAGWLELNCVTRHKCWSMAAEREQHRDRLQSSPHSDVVCRGKLTCYMLTMTYSANVSMAQMQTNITEHVHPAATQNLTHLPNSMTHASSTSSPICCWGLVSSAPGPPCGPPPPLAAPAA